MLDVEDGICVGLILAAIVVSVVEIGLVVDVSVCDAIVGTTDGLTVGFADDGIKEGNC